MCPPQFGFTYSAAAMACAKATTRAPTSPAFTQAELFPPGVPAVAGVEILVPGVVIWQRIGPLPYPPPAIQAKVAATLVRARKVSIVTTARAPSRTIKGLPELFISVPPSLQQRQQTRRDLCHHSYSSRSGSR